MNPITLHEVMTSNTIISIAVVLFGAAAAYQVYHLHSRVDGLERNLDELLKALERAVKEAKNK